MIDKIKSFLRSDLFTIILLVVVARFFNVKDSQQFFVFIFILILLELVTIRRILQKEG